MSFSKERFTLSGKIPAEIGDQFRATDWLSSNHQRDEDSNLSVVVGAGIKFWRQALGLSVAMTRYQNSRSESQNGRLGPMPLESFSADEVSILQSRYEQSETVGFYPTYRLGYQAALTKSWRFGAAVWWTSHVRLEKNTTVDDFTVLVDEQDRPVEAQVEGAENYKIPLTPTAKSVKEFQTYHPPVRYSLGLEKTWPRIFKWSTDIVIHGPGSNRDEERQKTNVTGSTAWEITALRKFPLRMGLDAFPDSRKPQTWDKLWVRQGEFLDFYGTTLGLGYRSGDWNLYGNVLYQKAVGRLDTTQNHATQTTKFSKISVQTVGASIGMTSSF